MQEPRQKKVRTMYMYCMYMEANISMLYKHVYIYNGT